MYLGALVGSAASFYAGSPPPWPFCHDCDLMITILNALAANHGEADEYVFAQHLKRFCDQGKPQIFFFCCCCCWVARGR